MSHTLLLRSRMQPPVVEEHDDTAIMIMILCLWNKEAQALVYVVFSVRVLLILM